MNLYGYVRNNPIALIDPEGLRTTVDAYCNEYPASCAEMIKDGTIPVPIPIIPNATIDNSDTSSDDAVDDGGTCPADESVDDSDNNYCEQLYEVDVMTCKGIGKYRSAESAQRCYASAAQRYSECLRFGAPRTELDTRNN